MAEVKEKKQSDYSNSAENLINPPIIGLKLQDLKGIEEKINECRQWLSDECSAYTKLTALQNRASEIVTQIKDMIDTQGSYQDLEQGLYAVKYRRMVKTYHVEPFKLRYSKYVPAVVEETINIKALEGLVKGGLLTEDDLKHPDVGVITEKPSYAYVVKVE